MRQMKTRGRRGALSDRTIAKIVLAESERYAGLLCVWAKRVLRIPEPELEQEEGQLSLFGKDTA